MTMLYTIGYYKAFKETLAKIEDVNVNGENMQVLFCKNEKGIFAIACKYRKGAPHRSCGHWHSGDSYYDIYFRKNFKTKEEGNNFFKKVKETKMI